ncbi:MAG: MlaD family protein, partial [Pseudomonadota bacterium]
SLQVGSPVMYRGLQIGQVERRSLDESYQLIEYRLFIDAPYDGLINNGTRFYDISGVSLALTSEGLELELESLETLAIGGVTFFTPKISSTAGLDSERVFTLFNNRNAAEESQFEGVGATHYFFSAEFTGGVEGLEAGAPIVWQGVRLGTVLEIELDLGSQPDTSRQIVVLDLQPGRVGREDVNQEEALADFALWIKQGMRAEIVTSNILTGSKRIQFVDRPDAPPAELDMDAVPYPRIPTIASEFGAVTQSVTQLSASLAELPYDELVRSAINLMNSVSALAGSADTRALPGSLNSAVASVEALVGEMQSTVARGEVALAGLTPESPLYVELLRTTRELQEAAQSVRELATLLEENPNALITGRR